MSLITAAYGRTFLITAACGERAGVAPAKNCAKKNCLGFSVSGFVDHNAGRRINFLTLCPNKLYRAIRFRKRDYLQILPVISSNPGKVVGPVFLGRSNEKLAAI